MLIDFVIAWVDGNDKEWQKKKALYSNNPGDKRDERYRDWDNLKYWFRGVEQFAPWVNRIYLITDHQAPEWINDKHPKLRLINHEEYIPSCYLPTFNPNAIELNFHRIPDLEEHFVYFNDDMFLINPVKETDFFKNGLPCDYAIESPITPNRIDAFNGMLMNNMILLNQKYDRRAILHLHRNKIYSLMDLRGWLMNSTFSILRRNDFFGFEYFHLSGRMLKSTLEKLWQEDNGWLDQTCQHKFRTDRDVNQYIVLNDQYVTGKFTPFNMRKYGKAFQLNDDSAYNIDQVCETIESGHYKEICLNDTDVHDFKNTKEKINHSFEQKFTAKSSFEK